MPLKRANVDFCSIAPRALGFADDQTVSRSVDIAMDDSLKFSLGDVGKLQLKRLTSIRESDELEAIRLSVAAEILECLRPFRFLPLDLQNATSTSEGTILMLFGWLDEELRKDPKTIIEKTGLPTYLAPEIAIHLLVDSAEDMNGRRPISLGERHQVIKRLTQLTVNYALIEQAQILSQAGAAKVDVEIRSGQRVALRLENVETQFGVYDHFLFYKQLVQYPYDDDDIVSEFSNYLKTRQLPTRCSGVSNEMRDVFGYGLEALLWLMTGPLHEIQTRPHNAVVLPMSELINYSVFPEGVDAEQLARALDAHTLKPRKRDQASTRRSFTEATGSETRLGLAPFFKINDDQIVTSPSLLNFATLSIFRNIMHGRLPSGRPSRAKTPLQGALGASRRVWTEDVFEESVRSEFRQVGFRCVEIKKKDFARGQIDGVVADVKHSQLWVVSVKDIMAALRPRQEMEKIDRFYKEFIPQLQTQIDDVRAHLAQVRELLSAQPGIEHLAADIGAWRVLGLFVTRELPPLAGMVTSNEELPRIVLRRDIHRMALL